MKKLSILIAGRHSTSVSLEDEFFAELKLISQIENKSLNQLITHIDKENTGNNLSSAIRIYILNYIKSGEYHGTKQS